MMFVSLTSLFFINCTSHSARRKIIFCEDSYPHTIRKNWPKKAGSTWLPVWAKCRMCGRQYWLVRNLNSITNNLVADCLHENYISEV